MKILVFQQNKSGESKIAGITKFGENRFDLQMISIDEPLPPVIDDGREFLPADIDADLVLDFLQHPDLSLDLAHLCREKGIPMVASGKKMKVDGVATPPTWCGLPRQDCLGEYGERFGAPEFEVGIADGKIESVTVKRGAPCGATWEAIQKIIGSPIEEAPTLIGLKVQFFCSADPAGWDPIYGKSPVHFAGNVHAKALERAIKTHVKK